MVSAPMCYSHSIYQVTLEIFAEIRVIEVVTYYILTWDWFLEVCSLVDAVSGGIPNKVATSTL